MGHRKGRKPVGKDFFYNQAVNAPLAFNFDNFLLRIAEATKEPKDVDVSSRFSTNIDLGIPFVSSPMDSVTETRMAIAMARRGGIGVIHMACSPEEQAGMVKAVKRAESFIIRDVITITRDKTVQDAHAIMLEHGISGLPVVEKARLVGIVTNRDVRDEDPSLKISKVMTRDLVTAREDITEDEAVAKMRKNKIEKLPVTDKKDRFRGLITYKDVKLKGKYRQALRDENGSLLVAAATSPNDLERAKLLAQVADEIVIDSSHFHTRSAIAATKKIIKETGRSVIIGNLGTKEGVVDAVSALDDGVTGLRVGIGSGKACITSEVTRAGSPTLYAVAQAADAVRELGADIPIIADGGIGYPGDAALAFKLGAESAMMGAVFAACDESPSPVLDIEGKRFKKHRGMGSKAVREKRAAITGSRYASKKIAEGKEIFVPYRGKADDVIDELVEGLRATIGYAGQTSVLGMRNAQLLRK